MMQLNTPENSPPVGLRPRIHLFEVTELETAKVPNG
jgi:hypothetical protein